MDAIIKLQGPRSSPSLFVSSILHSPLVFPFNIVTFDASGIPEWVRHHWVPDRPTCIRFQALPEHRPNQHSRQVKILICESRHEIDHIITSQVGRHAGEREGEGQHCLVQVDGRHCHPPAAFWKAHPTFFSQEWQGTLLVLFLVLLWSLTQAWTMDIWMTFDQFVCQVREELPLLLQNTLNAHGAQTLSVSKFIPSIVAGLSDSQVLSLNYISVNASMYHFIWWIQSPTSRLPPIVTLLQAAVRDACSGTLVEIYRHVGERVRSGEMYLGALLRCNIAGESRLAEETEHPLQQACQVHLYKHNLLEQYCKSVTIIDGYAVFNWKQFQPDGEVWWSADRGEYDAYSNPRCWNYRR